MSPRHYAKHMISPYFLSDPHYIDDRPKKVTLIGRFVNLFKSPAKSAPESLADQAQPETPEVEVDLKALREQRRAAKQSDQ